MQGLVRVGSLVGPLTGELAVFSAQRVALQGRKGATSELGAVHGKLRWGRVPLAGGGRLSRRPRHTVLGRRWGETLQLMRLGLRRQGLLEDGLHLLLVPAV